MRPYYTDSYTINFTAQVEESLIHAEKPAVRLSQSFFYPTSGGQPHDQGSLNDAAVLDVQVRPQDQAVLHLLDRPLALGEQVTAKIDWSRRFDHMRQHTGQHILSRAFEDVLKAQTVGFHLSENSVTIDLDRADIPAADLDTVENLANQIIAENRSVRAWFPNPAELAALSLRKVSDKVSGALRVVEVADFDLCACGGTHVAAAGEIGMIKIIRQERTKNQTRLEFRCGERALLDYRHKNDLLLNLATDLTVGFWEVPAAAQRLREENKALQKQLKTAQNQLLQYEAESLWQAAPHTEGLTRIQHVWEGRPPAELQGLAQHLAQKSQTLFLLGLAGEKGHLLFGCSADLGLDVVPLLKNCLQNLGSNSGGGQPSLAQGGGFSATRAQLAALLTAIA